MQRAASGLANAVLEMLGRAYGAHVLLLVGSGRQRRGCVVRRGVAGPARGAGERVAGVREAARGRAESAASRRRAHRHRAPRERRRTWSSTGSWDRRATGLEARGRGSDPHTPGDPGRRSRRTVRRRRGHRRARRADCHAPTSPSPSAPTRSRSSRTPLPSTPASCTSSTSASTCPGRRSRASRPTTSRGSFRDRTQSAHKYTRGVVGVRAGSVQYPGAGVLCVAGAASGLCGMVRYVAGAGEQVLAAHPDVVTAKGRVQAWTVGSGGGADVATMLAEAQADGVPIVVDADALALVEGPLTVPTVLTPHAGELARMTGADREAIEAAPLRHARAAAERYDAVVLLKGRHTVVARPDGQARITTTGVPWLATAGAGDVLAGLIGALLAAGLEPFDAAQRRLLAARRRRDVRLPGRTADRPRRRPGDPRGRARPALKRCAGTMGSMRPEIVVDLDAIRHNVADPEGPRRPRGAHDRRQGRRIRARHRRVRRGPPDKAARTGSAWPPSPRPSP